jgi:hypothetical protein
MTVLAAIRRARPGSTCFAGTGYLLLLYGEIKYMLTYRVFCHSWPRRHVSLRLVGAPHPQVFVSHAPITLLFAMSCRDARGIRSNLASGGPDA